MTTIGKVQYQYSDRVERPEKIHVVFANRIRSPRKKFMIVPPISAASRSHPTSHVSTQLEVGATRCWSQLRHRLWVICGRAEPAAGYPCPLRAGFERAKRDVHE